MRARPAEKRRLALIIVYLSLPICIRLFKITDNFLFHRGHP